MPNEFKLALAQAGSLGGSWLFIHLEAILLQDTHKKQQLSSNAKIERILRESPYCWKCLIFKDYLSRLL